MSKKRKKHSPEIKAKVALAALKTNKQPLNWSNATGFTQR